MTILWAECWHFLLLLRKTSQKAPLTFVHGLWTFFSLLNGWEGRKAPQSLCVASNGTFTCHCTKPVKYLQHRQQYLVLNIQLWVWMFLQINLWQVFASKMPEDFTNCFKRAGGCRGAVTGHLVITCYYLYSAVDAHTDVMNPHTESPNKGVWQNVTAEQANTC